MNWFYKSAGKGIIIAYHATAAGNAILQGGFKTRAQLSGKAILGGGTDNSVSFTTDWMVAKGIFDAVIFAWGIMNSPNPLDAIRSHYQSLSSGVQSSLKSMFQSAHGGHLDTMLAGYKPEGVFNFGSEKLRPLTEQQLQEKQYRPYRNPDKPDITGISDNLYYNWERPMNQKEIHDAVYSYIKSYLSADPSVYNPLFFGTDVTNFIGVDRGDIGIITAEIDIDPERQGHDDFGKDQSHRYVSSMAEIRVYDLSTIKRILDFDTECKGPKIQSGISKYYGTDEHLESAINLMLDFIHRRYREFEQLTGLSADQVVSVLQHYGHNASKVIEVFSAVQKASKLRDYKYYIDEYQKYKKKIEEPENIQSMLGHIPEKYRQMLLSGVRSTDVFGQLYDEDNAGYDRWWQSQEDAYRSEKEIEDWNWDRARDLKRFEEYGKPNEDRLKQAFGDQLPVFMELAGVMDQVDKQLMMVKNRW